METRPKASPSATGAVGEEVGRRLERVSGEALAADSPLLISGYQPGPPTGAGGAPGSKLRSVDNMRGPPGPEIVLSQVALDVGAIRLQEEPTLDILVGDMEAREMEDDTPTPERVISSPVRRPVEPCRVQRVRLREDELPRPAAASSSPRRQPRSLPVTKRYWIPKKRLM